MLIQLKLQLGNYSEKIFRFNSLFFQPYKFLGRFVMCPKTLKVRFQESNLHVV